MELYFNANHEIFYNCCDISKFSNSYDNPAILACKGRKFVTPLLHSLTTSKFPYPFVTKRTISCLITAAVRPAMPTRNYNFPSLRKIRKSASAAE